MAAAGRNRDGRQPRPRRAVLLLLLLATAWPGRAEPSPALVVAAADVRALSPDEAARGLGVQLEGVVTYFDPAWRLCFMQDHSAGIFVQLPPEAMVVAGDALTVAGVSAPGDFAPVVAARQLTRRGRAALPPPQRATVAALLEGRFDSQWIEIEGVVRSVSRDSAHIDLVVASDGARFQATLPRSEDFPTLAALTGATVRVRAACGTIFNRKRQLVGVRLFVPHAAAITTLVPPPADPFAVPFTTVNQLLGYQSSSTPTGRVRVHATVGLVAPGGDLYVADATGGMRVRLLVPSPLARGDEVEIAGFAVRDDFGAMLDDAVIRATGRRSVVVPAPLDVAEAMEGDKAAMLVALDAELVAAGRRAEGVTLVLRAQGQVLDADLPDLAAPAAAWVPGARLRVTGVCLPETDDNHRVRRFRLLVQSPADVAVLAAGPYWTTARLALAISALAAVTVAVVAWVVGLRRRVRAQTRQIRERFESAARLERRYAALFENASDVVYALDHTGAFTAINPAGEQVLGRSRHDLIGHGLAEILAPEYVERVGAVIRRKLAGEEFPVYEIEVQRPDGARVTLEVGSRAYEDDDGRPAIHGIARDVTVRRRAADALETARRAAEATSRAKSEFLAMMSHELRTPLNGVIGMNDILLASRLDQDQREMVLTIQESANLLVSIIGDVLDFAKMEAGKLRIEAVPFDLHHVIAASVDLCRARAGAKGLRLTVAIDHAAPWPVRGDPGRVRQILLNLIGNAVKFTEQGGVDVRVTREPLADGRERVRCEVADTGPGLSDDLRARLFRPFEQADSSLARTHGGSGLGLAICRQLVELMGGEIGVLARDAGAGATFWFAIPLAACASAPVASLPDAVAVTGPAVRVLVVEDNPVNRKVALRQLAQLGVAAEAACDGYDALTRLDREAYDVIFMDCHMPGIDGYETTRRLRRLPLASQPYVIASTANAMAGDREACLAAGMDDYVAKPARTADLAAALSRASSRRGATV